MKFRDALLREIDKLEATQKRMGDFHPDFCGNGVMGTIRAERLDLLRALLRFEPEPKEPLP